MSQNSANLIRTHDEEFQVPCSQPFHYGHVQVICTFKHLYFSHALFNKATNRISPKITHMLGLIQCQCSLFTYSTLSKFVQKQYLVFIQQWCAYLGDCMMFRCLRYIEALLNCMHCMGTLTSHLWIHYTDCWIGKLVDESAVLLHQSIEHVSIEYTCNIFFVMHWSI